MAEDKKTASAVPPYLVAALICDVAVRDPSSGKQNLIGIFDTLRAAKFPTAQPMGLYLKVTDASGYYPIRVDFVRSDSDKLLTQAHGNLNAPDRMKSFHMSVNFTPLPIPAAGRYEFRLYASEMYLGSAFLDASPANGKM